MSHTIEYQHACFAIPAGTHGLTSARYVVACECGSNNLYDHGKHRAREWTVLYVGTHSAALKQAVRAAADCEGGMLQHSKGRYTPEAYIGRIRRLMDGPPSAVGTWSPSLRVPANSPLAAQLLATGGLEVHKSDQVVQTVFAQDRLAEYFELIERHATQPGWYLAQVHGLPRS